jgi:hypothetical protein
LKKKVSPYLLLKSSEIIYIILTMEIPTQPNLALPLRAPSFIARYRHEPLSFYPAALYTLIPLSSPELKALQTLCESQTSHSSQGEIVRPAPRYDFTKESLSATLEYHLELCKDDEKEVGEKYNPIVFIVAVESDWKKNGVLLVTLDAGNNDGEEDGNGEPLCRVDIFRVKADDSGSIFANLYSGTSDWDEIKAGYESHQAGLVEP